MNSLEFIGFKTVIIKSEASVLELAQKNKIPISTSCGGNGTCGACRVRVLNYELLPPPNEIEQEMINDRGFSPEERLSCQIEAMNGLKIHV